jgi:cell wall-associated NlpC family hydrolase
MRDLSRDISNAVAEAEKALGLDWRLSFSHVGARADGTLVVELSREEVMIEVISRLGDLSMQSLDKQSVTLCSPSGEAVKLVLLGAGSDTALLTISSVADIRAEASHSSELLTQMIMGEYSLPLIQEGDWYMVRLADGYHGWVRSWYVCELEISEIDAYIGEAHVRVEANVSYVLSGPDGSSLPVSDVTAGTVLVAGDRTGAFRRVMLPGGREGYIGADDIAELTLREASRSGIVSRAKRFLGIPYLWGGASTKGFDCSGLVKRVFSMEGIELPRDSDQQAGAGSRIPGEEIERARTGDLLFFGEGTVINHVGILLGDGRFIHAYGDVRINSYRESDPLYEEKLAKSLLFACSILPPGG